MKLIKTKSIFNKYLSKSSNIFILFISIISLKSTLLNADDSFLNEIEIDSTTKIDPGSSDFSPNPFEIVEKLRRANSMNDATKPSDAIDDALKLFNKNEEKESL